MPTNVHSRTFESPEYQGTCRYTHRVPYLIRAREDKVDEIERKVQESSLGIVRHPTGGMRGHLVIESAWGGEHHMAVFIQKDMMPRQLQSYEDGETVRYTNTVSIRTPQPGPYLTPTMQFLQKSGYVEKNADNAST